MSILLTKGSVFGRIPAQGETDDRPRVEHMREESPSTRISHLREEKGERLTAARI